MILTSSEIKSEVLNGNIEINPFNENQLGTVSYKFRLGQNIAIIDNCIDSKSQCNVSDTYTIPASGFTLKPDVLYLAHTHEVLGSCLYAQKIFSIREIANFGIFINVSANHGHMGSCLKWTLELVTHHPVRIYSGMLLGQITFWETHGAPLTYQGKYSSMISFETSRLHSEFEGVNK